MTKKEKKELLEKRLAEGDKRSYYEMAADLELSLWTERFKDVTPPSSPIKDVLDNKHLYDTENK